MDNRDKLNLGLVSIIMPAYNSENFIRQSITSVQKQSYQDWELIIIDDCSVDTTVKQINSIKDQRIKLIELEKNSGAAIARNTGIKYAKGEFLAFLDSDDLWTKHKLERQLQFMRENNYDFTCTEYAHLNPQKEINSIVEVHDKLDYDGVLKYCPGNSTIMYNAKKLGKFYIPDIRKRNDFVMWLKVIKKAKYVYGLHEAHSIYRIGTNSLSSNKSKLIKYQWRVYREVEKLSLSKSLYLLVKKISDVVLKRNQQKTF